MDKRPLLDFSEASTRHELGRLAVCEIGAIIDVLDTNEHEGQIDEDLWRGMCVRLRALVGAAQSAHMDEDDLEDMADVVYGKDGWCDASAIEEAEAAHG